MPKVSILAGDYSKVDAAKGFSTYAGDTPPKGVYRTKATMWKIVDNSAGDQMLKIIFEIAEPKGSKKAKYNGYAIWHNSNLTEKGAPFANAMLDALGIPRKAVWGGGIITSKDDVEKIIKIGGKSPLGLEVMVSTARREYPKGSGDFSLNIVTFLGKPEEADEDSDDDDDEDDDEDEKPAKSKPSKSKSDDDDDEDDDDDDEDDEDDDSF